MKKKSKALNTTEISIVAALVFIISLGAVFTCGDYFAKIFGNNPILSMFTFGRGKNGFVEDITKYLSGITINFGGLNITSPVEDKFNETSGNVGDLQRHIAIIQDYIKMLEQIIAELEKDGADVSAFRDALVLYQNALKQYTDMNNLKVGDTFKWGDKSITISSDAQLALIKKAMDLDIMLDLTQSGSAASALNTALTSLLGKVDNETYKNLLEAFTKDLLSLGANTDFKVDSRLVGNNILPQDLINQILTGGQVVTPESYTPKSTDGLTITTMDFFQECNPAGMAASEALGMTLFQDVKSALSGIQVLNVGGELAIYNNGVIVSGTCSETGCTATINGYEIVVQKGELIYNIDVNVPTAEGGVYTMSNPAGITPVSTTTTGSSGLPADAEKLRNLLIAIALDPTNEKYKGIDVEALTKTIDVYRNGTYVDMAENTYNNAVVCTSMGGTVQGEQCTFN